MHISTKEFYNVLYRILNEITPLKVDCGQLCNGACCKGDGEAGMYLFPGEEIMYDGAEEWINIYDSDFVFNNKPVKIAICNGTCSREKRPLSCRIFPLFQDDKGRLCVDERGRGLCPLVTARIPFEQYDSSFLKRVKLVFKILEKCNTTNEYVKETKKLISEYKEMTDIFK